MGNKASDSFPTFWMGVIGSSVSFGLWQNSIAAGAFVVCVEMLVVSMLAINEAIQESKGK